MVNRVRLLVNSALNPEHYVILCHFAAAPTLNCHVVQSKLPTHQCWYKSWLLWVTSATVCLYSTYSSHMQPHVLEEYLFSSMKSVCFSLVANSDLTSNKINSNLFPLCTLYYMFFQKIEYVIFCRYPMEIKLNTVKFPYEKSHEMYILKKHLEKVHMCINTQNNIIMYKNKS